LLLPMKVGLVLEARRFLVEVSKPT
jgi:hypothetical protein